MKKVILDTPRISADELVYLIFKALEKSTYGGTKMGKPHPGDHKEE